MRMRLCGQYEVRKECQRNKAQILQGYNIANWYVTLQYHATLWVHYALLLKSC